MKFTKKFVACIFLVTNCISASSQEHKSCDTPQLAANLAQLQMSNNTRQVTGQIIAIAINHDYNIRTEHYSTGDTVTTILTGSDEIRETYIARGGKTHRTFFRRDQN